MNNRLNLVKVLLVLAVFIGLVGLWRQPATVQPQAQSGGPGTSAVALIIGIPYGPQTNVNWNG